MGDNLGLKGLSMGSLPSVGAEPYNLSNMDKRTQAQTLEVDAEMELALARVQLVRLEHLSPGGFFFRREGVYWVDLCLTPRRPTASARYVDRWGSHRFAEMGSIIALPPGENLHLRSA